MAPWLADMEMSRGAIMTLDQCWAMAQGWYAGRMEGAWRGRSPAAAQAILEGAGLTGPFWRMTSEGP